MSLCVLKWVPGQMNKWQRVFLILSVFYSLWHFFLSALLKFQVIPSVSFGLTSWAVLAYTWSLFPLCFPVTSFYFRTYVMVFVVFWNDLGGGGCGLFILLCVLHTYCNFLSPNLLIFSLCYVFWHNSCVAVDECFIFDSSNIFHCLDLFSYQCHAGFSAHHTSKVQLELRHRDTFSTVLFAMGWLG